MKPDKAVTQDANQIRIWIHRSLHARLKTLSRRRKRDLIVVVEDLIRRGLPQERDEWKRSLGLKPKARRDGR